jgi:hypothetical protein
VRALGARTPNTRRPTTRGRPTLDARPYEDAQHSTPDHRSDSPAHVLWQPRRTDRPTARALPSRSQIVEINGVPQPHAHQKRASGVSYEEFSLTNNAPRMPRVFGHHRLTQRFL